LLSFSPIFQKRRLKTFALQNRAKRLGKHLPFRFNRRQVW
jgi:hypothetical protein